MKVLFVCSQGMSSQIAVNALQKEAEKHGMEMQVCAISTQEFEDEIKNGWDAAMIAPQIRHRFQELKKLAQEAGVPCDLIEPRGYTPLGGAILLQQLTNLIKK